MALEVKAPNNLIRGDLYHFAPTVFLAGSIEMGKAVDWQERVALFFEKARVILFNPRRDNWDSSWEQDISNPNFAKQVNWELDMIELADMVLVYFDPTTKSPISLLELGMLATSKKAIVVCPQGFWRKGNVDIVCQREDIPLFETLEEALVHLKFELHL